MKKFLFGTLFFSLFCFGVRDNNWREGFYLDTLVREWAARYNPPQETLIELYYFESDGIDSCLSLMNVPSVEGMREVSQVFLYNDDWHYWVSIGEPDGDEFDEDIGEVPDEFLPYDTGE